MWLKCLVALLFLVLASGRSPTATTISVALHAGEVHYNLTEASIALDVAKELGAESIRTDLFWQDLEPDAGSNQWNTEMMDFYRSFIQKVQSKGLKLCIILSGGTHSAKSLYKTDKNAFLDAWFNYSVKAVTLVADAGVTKDVVAWQLWNEMNHEPSAYVNSDMGTVCSIFNLAAKAVTQGTPTAPTAAATAISAIPKWVNVMADDPINSRTFGIYKWQDAVEKWLAADCAGAAIDGIGIDHYPGTWTADPQYAEWKPLDILLSRVNNPVDIFHGKLAAVMETGFSTWAPLIADEASQQRWIERSLPAARKIIRKYQTSESNVGLSIFNYYQLVDVGGAQDAHVLPPEEGHFGITRFDFTRKPAFPALAEQLALIKAQK